jgi:GNAT superfamily N-acetyltransferase
VSVTHRKPQTQGDLAITLATSRRDIRQFVELAYTLYARESHWVPPLRRDEHHRLSPRHNPFHDHAEVRLWLARRHGQVVGRIAAIDDRLHNETHGERVTWFGFFEVADEETAHALLAVVEAHAVARGSTAVRGPASPSLNDSVGLLVDAFDHDPYILMPYNPPAYVRYVETAGYAKAKDLLAWRIDLTAPPPDRITRLADRVASQNGITVRPLELGSFERDLAIMQGIYRAAWQDNWGFVPPTDAEIRQLAMELRPILDPEIVLFSERAGRPVGCAVAIPDVNQVLKRMGGRLLPFGVLHFLRRRAIIDQARVLLLGVVPDMRRRGLYPLLIAELHRRGRARGYRRAELSWTLEDNDAVNAGIEAVGGRRHKTYRLYEKPLR